MSKMVECKNSECNNTFDGDEFYNKVYCSTECKMEQHKRDKRENRLKQREPQVCPQCNEGFYNQSPRPRIYCSTKCLKRATRIRKKEAKRKELLTTKKCEYEGCSKEFETIYTFKRFCSNKCCQDHSKNMYKNEPMKFTCQHEGCNNVFLSKKVNAKYCNMETCSKKHREAVCKNESCSNTFIYTNGKRYCSDECKPTYYVRKTPKKTTVKKDKKRKAKKKYTPISKPKKPKKVKIELALSKSVIEDSMCLEPKKRDYDDVVSRDYTDKEASMIEQFLKDRS